jgi:hypothetical protein
MNKLTASERAVMVGKPCKICTRPMSQPCYDEDPVTRKFRGWLCHDCNKGIGHFRDDPISLLAAAKHVSSKMVIKVTWTVLLFFQIFQACLWPVCKYQACLWPVCKYQACLLPLLPVCKYQACLLPLIRQQRFSILQQVLVKCDLSHTIYKCILRSNRVYTHCSAFPCHSKQGG